MASSYKHEQKDHFGSLRLRFCVGIFFSSLKSPLAVLARSGSPWNLLHRKWRRGHRFFHRSSSSCFLFILRKKLNVKFLDAALLSQFCLVFSMSGGQVEDKVRNHRFLETKKMPMWCWISTTLCRNFWSFWLGVKAPNTQKQEKVLHIDIDWF